MPKNQLTRKQNKEPYSKLSYHIFCSIFKIFYMNEVVHNGVKKPLLY